MRLVADANVLLSAVLGGKANGILEHPKIVSVHVAEPTFAEVERYAPLLARKRRLPEELVLLAVQCLPVTIVPAETYDSRRKEAVRRIASRDPKDVDTLALALFLRAPVWSNDQDFEDARVQWFTTAQLLVRLSN